MTYEITDTQEVQSITQAGTPKRVYRVWIVTENGSRGSVEIKPSNWETDKLKAILDAKAAELDLAFTITQS